LLRHYSAHHAFQQVSRKKHNYDYDGGLLLHPP